jgi:hypothetical protein
MLSNPNPVIYERVIGAVNGDLALSLETPGTDPFTCQEIFDLIRDINDPEHPVTLEQLHVLRPEHIYFITANETKSSIALDSIAECSKDRPVLLVHFTPTIPHCSMATLIGLSIRTKLERSLPPGAFRLLVRIRPGSHQSEAAINRQLADKERVAAASENPNLRRVVDACLMGPPRSGIAL